MKITHREIVYGEGYTFYISDEGIKVNTDVAGGRNCDLAMIKWDDLAYLAEHYHDAIMAGDRPGSFHDFMIERFKSELELEKDELRMRYD